MCDHQAVVNTTESIWTSKDFLIALIGFAGALLGGSLGVIGALLVSRNDFNAKIRSASIAVSVDMEKFIGIAVAHNKSGDDSIRIGNYLRDHEVHVSPLFPQHCVTLFGARLDYSEIQALVEHLTVFDLNYKELNRAIQIYRDAVSGPPKPRTDVIESYLRKISYNAICVNYILRKSKLVRAKGFETKLNVERVYKSEINGELSP